MPRVLKYKFVVKALNSSGYFEERQKGSHVIFKNDKGEITVVPKHSNGEVSSGLVGKICRDIRVEYRDFEKLIK
jgi:predicted RNA binding protein YcfA (HicA-like mRNA interferase family)